MPNQWTNPVPVGRPLHLHELGHPDAATKDPVSAVDAFFNPNTPGGLFPPLITPGMISLDVSTLETIYEEYIDGTLCEGNGDGAAGCLIPFGHDTEADDSFFSEQDDPDISWSWSHFELSAAEPSHLVGITMAIKSGPANGITNTVGTTPWVLLDADSGSNFGWGVWSAQYNSITFDGDIAEGDMTYASNFEVAFNVIPHACGTDVSPEVFSSNTRASAGTLTLDLPEDPGVVLLALIVNGDYTYPECGLLLYSDLVIGGDWDGLNFALYNLSHTENFIDIEVDADAAGIVLVGCEQPEA